MARKIDPKAALEQHKRRSKTTGKEKKVACRILIVCEGEKTEPTYFRSFDTVPRNFVYTTKVIGQGNNTMHIVEKAISLKEKAITPYDRVWAVFDRDSFPPQHFNAAIEKAQQHGIEVAWSNEAFELWFVYHFKEVSAPMNRARYEGEISTAIRAAAKQGGKAKDKAYQYTKTCQDIFHLLKSYGSQDDAIRRAQRQHHAFGKDKRFAHQNPCTTVYRLVNQLIERDEELIREVMAKTV